MARVMRVVVIVLTAIVGIWALIVIASDQIACNAKGGLYVQGPIGYQCFVGGTAVPFSRP